MLMNIDLLSLLVLFRGGRLILPFLMPLIHHINQSKNCADAQPRVVDEVKVRVEAATGVVALLEPLHGALRQALSIARSVIEDFPILVRKIVTLVLCSSQSVSTRKKIEKVTARVQPAVIAVFADIVLAQVLLVLSVHYQLPRVLLVV